MLELACGLASKNVIPSKQVVETRRCSRRQPTRNFQMGCIMDTETQNCVTILEENWLHVRKIDDVDKRSSQTNLENKTYDS